MNSISFLQQAAVLDSKNVFRRVIDHGLASDTDALLGWQRFLPETFGIDTPRHSPIFAKRINLPYYALLSDAVQEATLEELAKQYADEYGLNFTYVTEADAGIISIYICSHEVDTDMLIEVMDASDDEDQGFPAVDDDDEYDYLEDPQLLIGCDVLVDGELRTVADHRENEDESIPTEFFAILDNGQEIPVEEIERDENGEYFYESEDYEPLPPPPLDNDDDDDFDEEESHPAGTVNDSPDGSDDDDDDDSFDEEQPDNSADVLVPQIREGEQAPQSEVGDDDFPDEDLQPQTANASEQESELTEEQALAAAVQEEQAAQAKSAPIDWTKPPVEPVPAQAAESPVEGADDTFAEEPQGEAVKATENEAQAPADDAFRVIDDERVSVAEHDRRIALLDSMREQLPNDSVSEVTDGILNVLIVKDDTEYELTVKVVQQMFAGQKMIDVFVLGSKDESVGRRATNVASIIDAINSL